TDDDHGFVLQHGFMVTHVFVGSRDTGRIVSHRFTTGGCRTMTDTTPNTGLQFRTDVEEDYGPVVDWATDFDLMDPDYVVHPEQRWAEQREGCPIAFTERRQRTWLPVRYKDLSDIAHD